MASSDHQSGNPSMVTKDAMFLLELLRDSPEPIMIPIARYAAKMNVKPNTIIKRLAGIKTRNKLQISTTMGKSDRPALPNGRAQARKKKETVKQEHFENIPTFAELQSPVKHEEGLYGLKTSIELNSNTDIGLQTPTPSPSGSKSSQQAASFESFNSGPIPFSPVGYGLKRTYDQTVEPNFEYSQAEEPAFKKMARE